MRVTLDERSQRALDFVQRTMNHGAPERTALLRAERRFGIDRSYLRSLRNLLETK